VIGPTSPPPAPGPIPAAGRRWRPGRRIVVAAAAAALAFASLVAMRLLPHSTLRAHLPLSTAVTAADGTLLRLTLAADGQYRMWTPLERVSPLLIEATLLYEDRHFAWHPGVDPFALVRGAFATYLSGGRRIGGSTLTMQLARRLWSLSSHDVRGKLVQIGRAVELEALYSKREILEAYLNLAPYGGNIEGVGAASQIYFRKPPSALTLAEALTLAVIPQSPTRRSRDTGGEAPGASMAAPSSSLDRARTGLLASFMARARPAPSAEGEAPVARTFVRFWPRLRRPDDLPFAAPHFVDQILAQMVADPATAAPGRLPAIVPTTLDLHLQRLLERHLTAYVARERRRGIANAAALLVETRTLAVRALVGSVDFFDPGISGQVNGVVARRSPGSTLKPFAYALGLDQGIIHPATMLRDVPTSFAAYSPENFDGRFAGPLSARDALIRSRNVPALAIAARLSRPGFYDFLRTAGVDLPLPESHYGLGLVLGTGEVTMAELVRLYAALGNGGVVSPLVWRKPHDHEGEPEEGEQENDEGDRQAARAGVRLLSEESAFLVLDMLADNPRPTGRLGAVAQAHPLAVSWKTGTSWGFRDAWSVGLFGPYVLAIWIGDFSGTGNPAYVGAQAAAPLFFEIVDSIAAQQPAAFAGAGRLPPKGVRRVEICALSGGLPTAECRQRRMSWFIPGRSPIEPCQIHRAIALDAGGRRTCALGPPAVRTETFEVWPSDLTRLFAAAGLPRRPLPPAAPGCGEVEAARGAAPRITSPLAGVIYTLRPDHPESSALALQAVTDGDAAEVFWFADQAFVGRSPRGATFFWKPDRPGRYTLRAVDDLGRSDARAVAVEVLR
jgi:penicillin-binding protein 1C